MKVSWFKYVKPYLKWFILGPLCMIIEIIGEVFMPKFMIGIIDNGVENADVGYIIGVCAMMVFLALIMMAGGIGGAYFGAKASVSFACDLRGDVYKKVSGFSFKNIDKFSTGSLVTRLTNDITQLQNFINMLLRMCLRTPGMLIGAIIMAISIKPRLSLILLITIPLLALVQTFIIKKGFPRFVMMQNKIDGLNNKVQENLTNVRVVKSFVREDFENERFSRANADLKDAGLSAMNLMIIIMPVMMLIMNLTSVAVVWFGGNMVIAGGMTVGELTAFITYINQILMSLMMVTMLFTSSARAIASARRVKEVLSEENDIKDNPDSTLVVNSGDIEFKNVSFRYYKDSPEAVLKDISFKIKAGDTVGIVGSTGSGKTTLVSLISRLYDADEGEILVDGINVKSYSLKNLRDGIGTVLQKNVLFSGTIKENLLWGDENATDEEIKKVASYAQAHGFIESFSDGYDTVLGQGASNVSGGQKQRLCIARALLKKPKILILDDSTSAVDTATEKKINEAFKSEIPSSTKIIIAQRITSVINADMIMVLDDGKITGIGTHDELLNSNAEYQEIYYSQTEKKEEV